MVTYRYRARDKTGKLTEGLMEADSEATVAAKLTQSGYLPVSITSAKGEVKTGSILEGFQGIKFKDINMFTRQLFTLQKAGIPLLSSLRSLKEQTENNTLKNMVEKITRDIEAGLSLSAALEKYPHVFNPLYSSMVRAGEASGKLDEALQRLTVLGEHEEMVRMRISAAMRYPVIVVSAIVIGFFVLVTVVMPRFSKIYGQYNTALPLPTQVFLGINYVVTHFWWLLIIFVGGLIFLSRMFVRTPIGRLWWDHLKLRVPVFGPLIVKLIMSRFCRITGTLIRSGVPILQILDLGANSVGNVVIAKTINNIKKSVSEGKGMSEPVRSSGMFPPIVIQMITVGEESGKLDELLLYVSDYYDLEIDYTIQNLVSLIEPILIFVLGLAVLSMALAVFLPMWNLMNLFKR